MDQTARASGETVRREAILFVPGGLRGTSGGNVYDRVVVAALRRRGWRVTVSEEPGAHAADVVIQDSLAMSAGPPAGRAHLVVLLHQLPSDANPRPSAWSVERDVLRSASLVVPVGRHLADRAARATDAPVVVVRPGWDRAFAARPVHGDTVLCVANAEPVKGVADAIEAFARARLAGARFVLAGDPDRDPRESNRIRALASRLAPTVNLEGVVDPRTLSVRYAGARVFVSASRYEGWPIAVAEAMASGLPIVAFDVPGVRELVRDGVDGMLVDVGNVDGLALALGRLWRDRSLRERMGGAARLRARSWPTWDEAGRRFVDLLEWMVAKDAHPTVAR